jgi:hypothetical protein
MANEFIARKGIIVSGSGTVTDTLDVSGAVTASAFKGDGSQLTNLVSASYASTASVAITSSFAETSSVALKVRILSGSQGSGDAVYTGSFTGSFIGDGSGLTGIGGTVTVTGSAPSNPDASELWFDDTTGKTYIYYVSASQGQWILQSDPTYDIGAVVEAATSSIAFAIPSAQPATPITGSIYFSGSFLYVYNGTKYVSASLN